MPASKTSPNQGSTNREYIERYEPLLLDGYRADFSRDVRLHPPVYHMVITRQDDPSILVWSQANSLKGARVQAASYIRDYIAEKAERVRAGS